jgi:hypothetical protein
MKMKKKCTKCINYKHIYDDLHGEEYIYCDIRKNKEFFKKEEAKKCSDYILRICYLCIKDFRFCDGNFYKTTKFCNSCKSLVLKSKYKLFWEYVSYPFGYLRWKIKERIKYFKE